jgi:hypothetical protein
VDQGDQLLVREVSQVHAAAGFRRLDLEEIECSWGCLRFQSRPSSRPTAKIDGDTTPALDLVGGTRGATTSAAVPREPAEVAPLDAPHIKGFR